MTAALKVFITVSFCVHKDTSWACKFYSSYGCRDLEVWWTNLFLVKTCWLISALVAGWLGLMFRFGWLDGSHVRVLACWTSFDVWANTS